MKRMLTILLVLLCFVTAIPLVSANFIPPPEPYNFIENYLLFPLMVALPSVVIAVLIAYFIKKRKNKLASKQV